MLKRFCFFVLIGFLGQSIFAIKISSIPEKELPIEKKEFIEKFLEADNNLGTPAVFRGYAKDWPAVKNWSLEYFRNNFPGFKVSVQTEEKLTEEFGPVTTQYTEKTLESYINQLQEQSETTGYLSQFPIAENFPSLLDDLKFPPFYSSRFLTVSNIWLGPKGTKSKLHYDSDQNFFVQIYGEKKVRLISPKFSKNCYPVNKSWYDAYSPVDIENIALEKFPEFDRVEIYEATLKPGDMLYIPKLWWHDIRSLSSSISANFWWVSFSDFFVECCNETKACLLGGQKSLSKNSYVRHLCTNLKKYFWPTKESKNGNSDLSSQ